MKFGKNNIAVDFFDYLLKDIFKINNFALAINENRIHVNFSNGESYIEDLYDYQNLVLSADEIVVLEKIIEGKFSFTENISYFRIAYFFISEQYLDTSFLDKHKRYTSENVLKQYKPILYFPIVNILVTNFKKKYSIKEEAIKNVFFSSDFDLIYNPLNFGIKSLINDALKLFKLNKNKLAFDFVCQNLFGAFSLSLNKNLNFDSFNFKQPTDENIRIKNLAFFITGNYNKFFDGRQLYSMPSLKKYIKNLNQKKVEIGLHTSYNSHENFTVLEQQKKDFKTHFNTFPTNNRYHYLRCNYSDYLLLEAIGIKKDFSHYFADSLLFRSGISSSFKLWNFNQQKKIDVEIYPITLMECTLDLYLKLSYEDALIAAKNKIHQSIKFGNTVVLLWHNACFSQYLNGDGKVNYHPQLLAELKQFIHTFKV